MTLGYWDVLVRGAFEDRAGHVPPDRATARAAAFELRSRGLTPRDVASALKLSEGAVRALLGNRR